MGSALWEWGSFFLETVDGDVSSLLSHPHLHVNSPALNVLRLEYIPLGRWTDGDFQRTEGWTGMMTSQHWEPITRPFLALERHVTPEAPITRDLTLSRLPAHSRHFQAANQRE
ncbi:hypothetical protein Pcinc_026886 [Petrolisthes cinctipes]|uniref:Uncharacterized protein n=1 Tax=Petrolisthes cinctipes TaxID=88211 RepID=A0AAE1KB14_PETCI|nr:hypothetical protein Pcinc_026886 [Petrolisthes cinctipes]